MRLLSNILQWDASQRYEKQQALTQGAWQEYLGSVEYVDMEVVTVDKLSEYNNLCLCNKGIWI